ncbi:MAG: peptidoglycan-binding protein [Acidimicrobiales bacterium]
MNPPLDRTPHDPRRGSPRGATRPSTARSERSDQHRDGHDRHVTRDPRDRAPRTRDDHDQRDHPRDHRRAGDGGHHGTPFVHVGAHPDHGHGPGRVDRRPLLVVGIAATLVCGFFAVRSGDDGAHAVAPADSVASTLAATTDTTVFAQSAAPAAGVTVTDPAATGASTDASTAAATAAVGTDGVQDLDGEDLTTADTCLMDKLSVRQGESGASVSCLQQALTEQGFYTGPISGVFDGATFQAVEAMQTDRNLYVDGIVGRESALSLGIWPDEESFVTRTPPPPPGAVDLLGYPLSSVASAGDDAPPLPENSGTGRRLVYDRAGQRVWAVGDDGSIIRSWLVSGSKYSNEMPGTHEVYSKSEVSTAWNGKAYLPHMVRWLKTQKGAIGFHGIPTHVEDGSPYQTEAELGTRLSGGCQRQANADADFVWAWADIGTKVVVI